jgi:hypothetical protein
MFAPPPFLLYIFMQISRSEPLIVLLGQLSKKNVCYEKPHRMKNYDNDTNTKPKNIKLDTQYTR